jgi:hypothetical protein
MQVSFFGVNNINCHALLRLATNVTPYWTNTQNNPVVSIIAEPRLPLTGNARYENKPMRSYGRLLRSMASRESTIGWANGYQPNRWKKR